MAGSLLGLTWLPRQRYFLCHAPLLCVIDGILDIIFTAVVYRRELDRTVDRVHTLTLMYTCRYLIA